MKMTVFADKECIAEWQDIKLSEVNQLVDLFQQNILERLGRIFVFDESKLVSSVSGIEVRVKLMPEDEESWTAERIKAIADEEAFDKAIADTPVEVAQAWLDETIAEKGEDQDLDELLK